MMTTKTALFATVVATMLLAACGGDAEPSNDNGARGTLDAADMAGRIQTMEDTLFAKDYFDRKGAQALLDVYKAFSHQHPADTLVPHYLFKAAGLSKALGEPQESIRLYDEITKKFSNWYRMPDCYYLKAIVIDSDLKEKGEAEKAYKEVIGRFPDHPFAEQAKMMIENLKYTDEELIERFKAMEAQEEARNGGN